MAVDVSDYHKLSPQQAGHLRHFHNLATQLDGEWRHMGCQEPMQEFLDAYRFQLATMAYATALAHYHRQPILRTAYKNLMRQLIHKMLRRECWGYWFNTSLGGVATDPDLKELRKPWADPVIKENIMYSGHLLMMTSLYATLFDDDEFEKEGSIVFDWNPLFFGMGHEKFAYSNGMLQKAILDEMERNGWVGVCCEPNLVFVVCNQFPLIGMRLNDVRHGTHVIDEVLPKYTAALAKKQMVEADKLFVDAWMEKQDKIRAASDPGWTAWAAAYMNSWNSDFVRRNYKRHALGYITTFEGKTRLNTPAVGNAFRELVETESASPDSPQTLRLAKEMALKGMAAPRFPYTKPIFGYVVQWLSELGMTQELDGLLEYADMHLVPKWEDGGLYYPRNDVPQDEEQNWTHLSPFCGNASIGYARLNVEDGQKKMWDAPWTKQQLESRPWVDGASLSDGVDFLRGISDTDKKCLVLTMQSWDGSKKVVTPTFKNLEEGKWTVYVNGTVARTADVVNGGEITVKLEVAGSEVDVVVIKQAQARSVTVNGH